MFKQIIREYNNIFKMNPAPLKTLLKSATSFPIRFFFNADTSPAVIILEVTYRCNLICEYCLLKSGRLNSDQYEMSIDEIRDIIIKASGFRPGFYLTGGEPLLRDDLEEIIAFIRAHNMKTGIITNATLLTRERLISLNKAGLTHLVISYDLSDPLDNTKKEAKVNEKVNIALSFISELDLDMKVVLNTVISEENFVYLPDFLDRIDSMKVDALKLSYIYFSTDFEETRHKSDCMKRLCIEVTSDSLKRETSNKGEEIAKVVKYAFTKIKGLKTPVTFSPNLKESEIINWFNDSKLPDRNCFYTYNIMRLTPGGDINPCHHINKPFGNALSDDILQAFNSKEYKLLRRELKKSLFPGCTRCNKL